MAGIQDLVGYGAFLAKFVAKLVFGLMKLGLHDQILRFRVFSTRFQILEYGFQSSISNFGILMFFCARFLKF